MRFIIYGVGAIGGTLAGLLSRAGYEVIGIARGRQLEALRQNGLLLRTPGGDIRARFACAAHPRDITFQPGDIVLLTMKSQHTADALLALAQSGLRHQTVVCMQNGVANERMALRYFENVLGAAVMLPAVYLEPGEVAANGVPRHGLFDIGAYPKGLSSRIAPLCDALDAAGFAAFAHDDVMRSKYGKLLVNLVNGIDPALGAGARDSGFVEMARAEALAVYKAAGIAYNDVSANDPRRKQLMHEGAIAGFERIGTSAAQSLARGAGSVETDYLNGEIVLMGRLHGVATPVNAFLCDLTRRLIAEGAEVGSLTEAEVEALFAAWQAQ